MSLLTLLAGILFSLKRKPGGQRMLFSYQWLMMFLFIAAARYFVPYYLDLFQEEQLGEKLINTVFLSAHHTIRLFVVGAEYMRNIRVCRRSRTPWNCLLSIRLRAVPGFPGDDLRLYPLLFPESDGAAAAALW